MLPPHVDQLRSPRAGSDKTQLPFSPSRNKIKLKRKVWLSKEFHLISIKESVSLALRFVLQPAGIKGTAKKLFGFFHDLRQGGQKGAGTGKEEDTSWASTVLNRSLPAVLPRLITSGPATSWTSPPSPSTTVTSTDLLKCSLAGISLPTTMCSTSGKICNMTCFKLRLLGKDVSIAAVHKSVPLFLSAVQLWEESRCQRFHDFLCSV